MFKKQLTILSILLTVFVIVALSHSQTPRLLNYQGKLVNKDGTLASGTLAMTFSIYSLSTGGQALWQEPGRAVNVLNGNFNVLLGSVVPFPETLFTGSGERYLGIKVGDDPEMTPRFQLTSVGYAIRSLEADGVKDGAITAPKIVDGAVTEEKIANGAVTQDKLASGITDDDWTISGSNMSAAVSGNVGIGTTTAPTKKLQVAGAIQSTSDGYYFPDGTNQTSAAFSPIAYASMDAARNIKASSNVTLEWNSTDVQYEITVSGEYYEYNKYITLVTPATGGLTPYVGSKNGKLIIVFLNSYNLQKVSPAGGFQFVTFKL